MFDWPKTIELPTFVVVSFAVVVLILLLLIWSLKRRRNPKLKVEGANNMRDLIPSIVGVTHGALVEGNRVEIFENGAFFDAVYEALESAKHSISFESYLWKPGKVSERIVSILSERSAAGVKVRVLLDSSGGKITKEERKRLEDAKCQVALFHPLRFSNIGRMNNRDHRKLIIVDGRLAFVGGHCIVDDWLGDAQDKKHFRDISVRIEGAVVRELQGVFQENWLEETGGVMLGEEFFPTKVEANGETPAHAVYVTPAGSVSSVELLHYAAIHAAKTEILIQNPYFLPDPQAIDAFAAAVKRGVRVRIMVPSASASDNPIVQHAGHHRFGALLEAGIELYEYERTLLHQKVMTVDCCWVSVGSANFDDRSFELNDELTVGLVDDKIATRFREIFESDLKHCSKASMEEWKKRSIQHKMKDMAAYLVNEQL
jgi:cardiolipin synthase A/B